MGHVMLGMHLVVRTCCVFVQLCAGDAEKALCVNNWRRYITTGTSKAPRRKRRCCVLASVCKKEWYVDQSVLARTH